MPGSASGFCVYNDAALAIARLLELGAERVAYVDVDVHHGDGVQAAFWDDPRVLTVSLHEHPADAVPADRLAGGDRGPRARRAARSTWPCRPGPGTPDGCGRSTRWCRSCWRTSGRRCWSPSTARTRTSRIRWRIWRCRWTRSGRWQEACHELAHEHSDGRWVALGGGGYAVVDVVPRTWTHLVAIAAGRPVPPETEIPQEWRQEVYAPDPAAGAGADDGRPVAGVGGLREAGYDPADRLDQAVLATRRAVFPLRGCCRTGPEPGSAACPPKRGQARAAPYSTRCGSCPEFPGRTGARHSPGAPGRGPLAPLGRRIGVECGSAARASGGGPAGRGGGDLAGEEPAQLSALRGPGSTADDGAGPGRGVGRGGIAAADGGPVRGFARSGGRCRGMM